MRDGWREKERNSRIFSLSAKFDDYKDDDYDDSKSYSILTVKDGLVWFGLVYATPTIVSY